MKKIKLLFSSALAILFACTVLSGLHTNVSAQEVTPGAEPTEPVAVEVGFGFDYDAWIANVGEDAIVTVGTTINMLDYLVLNGGILPENVTIHDVTSESNGEGTITVSGTSFTVTGPGMVSIVAIDSDSLETYEFDFYAAAATFDSITLSASTLSLNPGESASIMINTVPEYAAELINVRIDNTAVATYELVQKPMTRATYWDGEIKITAKGAGTTILAVSNTAGTITSSCVVTVKGTTTTEADKNNGALSNASKAPNLAPATGDNTNMAAYGWVTIASLAAASYFVLKRRENN